MKTLVIDEDIGIKKINSFKELLVETMKKNNEILLNFHKVRRLDLSVIQVIIAAMKEAKIKNKKLKLKGLVSVEIKKQFSICGLIKDK